FFENPDNTHCYQASLRMVLKYFLPKKDFSWEELEKLTAKEEGYWTWPYKGTINLHKMGFKIVEMNIFNIERFVKEGVNYLIEKYGKDVSREQVAHTKSITNEQKICRDYLKLDIHQGKLPTLEDVKKLIEKGYLVVPNINARILNGRNGYSGHNVVIFNYDNDNVYVNDPGPTNTSANKKISNKLFMRAWEYPYADAKGLQAFKLP
ncbi:MAG: C39 family peptidase, partial [Patescibacteria group bacterium]